MTPHEVYPKSGPSLLIIYDLRVAGTAERLSRELSGWRGHAEIAAVGDEHLAMIVHPGLAARIVALGLPSKKGIA